jgi:hypothetical protein
MQDDNDAVATNGSGKRVGLKIALVAAGIAAGAIGATAIGANATTAGSGTTSASGSAPSSSTTETPKGPGGANPVRSDEKLPSADIAAKLKAAALAKVPGATVIRAETDAGDAVYEVHMKKADGSLVTVKFDKNLAVTAVEDGMGKGDPGGHGGPGGPRDADGDGH